eukprot:SAG11_NODE_25_length_23789_cov_23.813592_14_plen_37_part_00
MVQDDPRQWVMGSREGAGSPQTFSDRAERDVANGLH